MYVVCFPDGRYLRDKGILPPKRWKDYPTGTPEFKVWMKERWFRDYERNVTSDLQKARTFEKESGATSAAKRGVTVFNVLKVEIALCTTP